METKLKNLYYQEIDCGALDFDSDRAYRLYLARSQALWPDQELPQPVFDLLDTANFLSFAHGFRLGVRLARWAREIK